MKKIQRYAKVIRLSPELSSYFTPSNDINDWCKGEDVAKLETENKWLQHEYDSTCGLWCTDKPDLIPENIKHLFFQLGDK